MTPRLSPIAGLALAVALLPGSIVSAGARIVSFEFRGTINEVVENQWGDLGAWGVEVGDPFWGTLTYDTATPGQVRPDGAASSFYYDPTIHFDGLLAMTKACESC